MRGSPRSVSLSAARLAKPVRVLSFFPAEENIAADLFVFFYFFVRLCGGEGTLLAPGENEIGKLAGASSVGKGNKDVNLLPAAFQHKSWLHVC